MDLEFALDHGAGVLGLLLLAVILGGDIQNQGLNGQRGPQRWLCVKQDFRAGLIPIAKAVNSPELREEVWLPLDRHPDVGSFLSN